MPLLPNVQVKVGSAPGTGAFALGGATPGAQSFAAAGAVDGARYSYRAEDSAGNWEIGSGIYAASGPSLSRALVLTSSSGAAISFGADVIVSQVALPTDLGPADRQCFVNGAMRINSLGSPSGSTSYSAGQFIFDRWKAGASGATLSYTTDGDGNVIVQLTAGSFLQVIEGALYLQRGGIYMLSQQGTAPARAYVGNATGSYAAAPLRLSVTPGANLTIEFSTGTIYLPQLEYGPNVTDFEFRRDEYRRCLRYRETVVGVINDYVGGGVAARQLIAFAEPKARTPDTTLTVSGSSNLSATPAVDYTDLKSVRFNAVASSTGYAIANVAILLVAEL